MTVLRQPTAYHAPHELLLMPIAMAVVEDTCKKGLRQLDMHPGSERCKTHSANLSYLDACMIAIVSSASHVHKFCRRTLSSCARYIVMRSLSHMATVETSGLGPSEDAALIASPG